MKGTSAKILTAYALTQAHLYCQNLILNGSFESPSIPSNTSQGTVPTFWTQSGTTRAVQAALFNGNGGNASVWPLPEEEQQYADIGNSGTELSQAFSITNSGLYQLSWWDSSGHNGLTTSPYAVVLLTKGLPVTPTNLFNAYHQSFGAWQERSLQVSLDSGQYTLEFVSQGVANGLDSLIDNVSLNRSPEPSVISGLFNTGVDENGTLLAGGSPDPHYALIASADSTLPGPSAYVQRQVPPQYFEGNGPKSAWISPQNSSAQSCCGVGHYVFRLLFDLTGLDPQSARIVGVWSSDNEGIDILINGLSTANSNPAQYTAFAPFTISNNFLTGTNSLDFVVSNDPGGSGGQNPTSLRVELSGSALQLQGGGPTNNAIPPSITQQPVGIFTNQGATVSFEITAIGTPPLAYQWQLDNTNILGATSPALILTNVVQNDEGEYSVVVSNIAGKTYSIYAPLLLNQPPMITRQPISIITNEGAAVSFSVSATGSTPLSYQWMFNSNAIASATNSILTLTNVQTSQAGVYFVTVSNVAASMNSTNASLLVVGPPVVSFSSPTNGASFAGGSNILISASASEPDGTIRNVKFFLNSTILLGSIDVPPYALIWSNVPVGTNLELTAVAVDGFGLIATSSVFITITNRLLPPGPPVVSIISPSNGATFNFGSSISVTASAHETNGSIREVLFVANSNAILGSAASSPYNILWTNAAVGTDSLMAIATDLSGISATSVVDIVVLAPAQPPSFVAGPDITIPQNSGPQIFTNWASSINPGTPSGNLYFVVTSDNTGLFSAPATLTGDGTLTFSPAANAAGVANCQVVLTNQNGLSSPPTDFKISVVAPKDVAIILASAGADPGPVTNDVGVVSLPGEQSLSFEIFPRSQLGSPVLSLFKVILWYDPQGTMPVSASEVSLLQNLYSNSLPLIFVGPRLVSSGSGAAWQQLLHLQGDNILPISGTVNPADSSGSGTLLPNGAYGTISPFNIQTLVDGATVTQDADSCGQLGTNDVLVSFPSANAPNADLLVRTFTELLPLGQDADSQSFSNRNEILQNAICWVLHCGACPAVFLGVNATVNPNVPQTGQPATLSFALGNSGECDGAAYRTTIQLDPGLRSVSASSDYGQVTSVSNLISVFVGRIPARKNINLTITVLPVVPGWVTNQIHIQSASAPVQDFPPLTFEVQGERIPELAIQQNGPTSVLLSAWAQAGVAYALERALLQPQGGAFIWAPVTNFIFANPVFQMQDAIHSINSGFMYRLSKQ